MGAIMASALERYGRPSERDRHQFIQNVGHVNQDEEPGEDGSGETPAITSFRRFAFMGDRVRLELDDPTSLRLCPPDQESEIIEKYARGDRRRSAALDGRLAVDSEELDITARRELGRFGCDLDVLVEAINWATEEH
jgi:hypothetical protein